MKVVCYRVVWQKAESPVVNFSLTHEAPCMSDQQQYGLLPCLMQGGVNHETTGKRPYLVRINRVLHVVDIHTPDPESPVRSPAEGRIQGSYGNNGLRIRR